MSDKPDSVIVRMLRWIDSGVSRLMERVGHTEQQAAVTHISLKEIAATLQRIDGSRRGWIKSSAAYLRHDPLDPRLDSLRQPWPAARNRSRLVGCGLFRF